MCDPPPQEDAEGGFRAIRHFIRCNRTLNLFYRVAVGVLGGSIAVVGLALIPLPGPGWFIVFAGLALLATEFTWAARLLGFAKRHVQTWTAWVTRQPPAVRALIGLAGLAVVAGLLWWYVHAEGVPKWIPLIG